MRAVLLASILSILSGCTASLTELVVVIDTDYLVPSELDDVRIVVTEPDGMMDTVVASFDTTGLPVSLGVVHRGGPLDPVRITVSGRHSGATLVHREVVTGFVSGETREVRLDLLRACAGDPCGADLTCVGGACVGVGIAASALPPFTGTATRLDGGGPPFDGGLDASDTGSDAGIDGGRTDTGVDACVVGTETCDGFDQDCDGVVDNGACICDPPCALDHATALCTMARTCAISSCDTGYSNCDLLPETGCERSIHTLSDCGGCDRPCASSAGSTTCADGTCRIATCSDSRYRDCNGEVSDGCETRVDNDPDHCGGCTTVCPAGMRRCMVSICR